MFHLEPLAHCQPGTALKTMEVGSLAVEREVQMVVARGVEELRVGAAAAKTVAVVTEAVARAPTEPPALGTPPH